MRKKKRVIQSAKNRQNKSTAKYADTFFRALYSDKKRAKELCEATSKTRFPDDAPVHLCNLEGSVMSRYNDMGVAIERQLLVLCEQQSTINPNMPYRFLDYVVRTYETWFLDKTLLYGETLVMLPTPKFFMLYNGTKPLKENVLKLSSAFAMGVGGLELEVSVIDINYERGHEILEKCSSLKGYSYLVHKIRKHRKAGNTRDVSIAKAVRTCMAEGILADFLNEHNFMEVCAMLHQEYKIEDEIAVRGNQREAKGLSKGLTKGLSEGLSKSAQIIRALKDNVPMNQITKQYEVTEEQVIEIQEAMFSTV